MEFTGICMVGSVLFKVQKSNTRGFSRTSFAKTYFWPVGIGMNEIKREQTVNWFWKQEIGYWTY